LEAPPGFEPGMEVLQISLAFSIVLIRLALWSLVFPGFPRYLGVRGLKLD